MFGTLSQTTKLMQALVRMKPKPHDTMKLGKASPKKAKSPARKRVSAKPKNA